MVFYRLCLRPDRCLDDAGRNAGQSVKARECLLRRPSKEANSEQDLNLSVPVDGDTDEDGDGYPNMLYEAVNRENYLCDRDGDTLRVTIRHNDGRAATATVVGSGVNFSGMSIND